VLAPRSAAGSLRPLKEHGLMDPANIPGLATRRKSAD
jgi:hypothetical protein